LTWGFWFWLMNAAVLFCIHENYFILHPGNVIGWQVTWLPCIMVLANLS
jgi:hypothetical protein